jgi:hypothetical protein
MMTLLLGIGAVYLLIAGYLWWFVVSVPKVSIRGRPQTFSESIRIARREGWGLALLALGWLPLLLLVIVNNVNEIRRDRIAAKKDLR